MRMSYVLAFLLYLIFSFIERHYRHGKEMRSINPTKYDKSSWILLLICSAFSGLLLLLSIYFNAVKINDVGSIWTIAIGCAFMTIGILIWIMAASTLGRFATRMLKITEKHRLITTGIYRYVRHPIYFANLLFFLGLSIEVGNLVAIIGVPFLFIIAYIYRINVEENMLLEFFGEEYRRYQSRTKKLIPFVF